MADKKISELSLLTSPTASVQIPVVDPVEVDANLKNKYLPYKAFVGATGWIPVSDTWTYASATTITVPSGAASIYSVGMGFQLTANSVVKKGYIVKVENTLLTVAGDALTNYTFSAISYAPNPQTALGFPVWFSWTPTIAGAVVGDGTVAAAFAIHGKILYLNFSFTLGATSSVSASVNFVPPVPISSLISFNSGVVDSGVGGYVATGDVYLGNVHIFSVQVVSNMLKAVGFSSTSPFTWAASDSMWLNGVFRLA